MNILHLLTKENISLFIAIVGLALSVINAIKQELFNRANIRLTYRNHYIGETANFDLLIENCSKLDISIARMFLIVNNQEFEFRHFPKTIWKICKNDVTEKEIESVFLPQTIPGFGAVGGYFSVNVNSIKDQIRKNGIDMSIKVITNRGTFLFPFTADKYELNDIY